MRCAYVCMAGWQPASFQRSCPRFGGHPQSSAASLTWRPADDSADARLMTRWQDMAIRVFSAKSRALLSTLPPPPNAKASAVLEECR